MILQLMDSSELIYVLKILHYYFHFPIKTTNQYAIILMISLLHTNKILEQKFTNKN